MSVTPKTLDMGAILADTSNRVVVCCGAGGVGKTTTAAALALRAAEYGRTVVVLTIDPAKRLAQALGINDLGNTPQRVPLAPEVPGELHAMMLDMRRTFDEMVMQYSGPERAQSILDNQFYQTVATSLAGTQEYMAMEKLGQLLSQDRWDLIVVDTPPSRNALDFLDAPKRLGSFMDSRLWRLLLAPGRGIGRLITGVMALAMKALSTVLGSQMLADAAAFVQSLDATFGGFREKADRTYALLKRRGTQFVVVSAAEPDALREASFFVDRLSQESMPLAGLVFNRTHPMLCALPIERAIDAAETLDAETTDSDATSLAAAVLRIHAERGQTAKREIRLLSRFTGANPTGAVTADRPRRCGPADPTVPAMSTDPAGTAIAATTAGPTGAADTVDTVGAPGPGPTASAHTAVAAGPAVAAGTAVTRHRPTGATGTTGTTGTAGLPRVALTPVASRLAEGEGI